MNKMKNLFDLEYLDDLPDDLKSDLKILKRDDFELKIIELFKRSSGELNIDQIQAGYFRLHNEIKDRRQMTAKLYTMCKDSKPAIKAIEGKKGVYKKNDTRKIYKKNNTRRIKCLPHNGDVEYE